MQKNERYYQISYRQGKKKTTTIIVASSQKKALIEFQKKNKGIVTEVKEVLKPVNFVISSALEQYKSPIRNTKVNQEQYVAFLEQFATMIDAGMGGNVSLEQCIEDSTDKMIKAIFTNVLNDVESGQSLTQSLSQYEKQLGKLSISLFQLGEQTGTLAQSVTQLARILNQIDENKRKLKKAIRYPTVIIVSMVIAFSVVIEFVVPQFKSIFKQLNMELPLPTRMLINIEYFISNYGLFTLGSIIVFIVFVRYMYAKNSNWKYVIDKHIFKVYIIGKVTYFSMIGRFTYLFEVLIDSGIPMFEAIGIARGVVDNSYMNRRLEAIGRAIEDGKNLTQGFRDSEQFENMVIQMVAAGETSGSLGKMLGKINDIYDKRYNYIIDNISTLIEPILIAAIAVFVLILALGIFLPMWSMVELAG